uniref:Uncharacterized protein n=1 Tax=Panagrolaimus sp. JU765 TaxID=591449 RepID=A0AC34QHF4_9BILA
MSSFLTFLKTEIITLLKLPTMKRDDSKKIRIQNKIVEMKPSFVVKKRRSCQKKELNENILETKMPSRLRSLSAPQNLKIEQQHVSRTCGIKPQGKFGRATLSKMNPKSQVRTIRGRSSTFVHIELK